ncbi:hypothetical protein BC937DRAFT_92090 [Endogone sp. FLAS-F59071]|nr:hypothetical protein BC937DRAFT_92090 [Endogone sp. FLAS-F59071]|eukprot:RUS15713.1 hypothetical protein BC937DRAFT_92090 [Endogone sp. FLAS-F59071]
MDWCYPVPEKIQLFCYFPLPFSHIHFLLSYIWPNLFKPTHLHKTGPVPLGVFVFSPACFSSLPTGDFNQLMTLQLVTAGMIEKTSRKEKLAGQESFRSITRSYYRGAAGALLGALEQLEQLARNVQPSEYMAGGYVVLGFG